MSDGAFRGTNSVSGVELCDFSATAAQWGATASSTTMLYADCSHHDCDWVTTPPTDDATRSELSLLSVLGFASAGFALSSALPSALILDPHSLPLEVPDEVDIAEPRSLFTGGCPSVPVPTRK